MEQYKAPRDKLLCLVNVKTMVENIVGLAAKAGANIGGALRACPYAAGHQLLAGVLWLAEGAHAAAHLQPTHSPPAPAPPLPATGADAFFPAFLFVVIRSRLPRLASNVEYIKRYRAPRPPVRPV